MTVVEIPKRLQDEEDQLKIVNGEIERTCVKKKTICEWIQRILGLLFLIGLIVMLVLFFYVRPGRLEKQ